MPDLDLRNEGRKGMEAEIRRGCCEYMYRAGMATMEVVKAGATPIPPGPVELFAAGAEWACEQSVGIHSAGMLDFEDLERLSGVANSLSRGLPVRKDGAE